MRGAPPVLLEIGASGEVYPAWEALAAYSTCIAFDADEREMAYIGKEDSGYKKLVVCNRIAADSMESELPFYLTKSPFCSSLLEPNHDELKHWSFQDLFRVERKQYLKSVGLRSVLAENGLDRVDWFKTDSQGTDLRLFKSLGDNVIERVIAADFEPGIMNAYIGEDRLYALMAYMDTKPFWVSDMDVHGVERISPDLVRSEFSASQQRLFTYGDSVLRQSPGWAEISYFAAWDRRNEISERDYLVGCAFALVRRQYGFVLETVRRANEAFPNPLFSTIKEAVKSECIASAPPLPATTGPALPGLRRLKRIVPRPLKRAIRRILPRTSA